MMNIVNALIDTHEYRDNKNFFSNLFFSFQRFTKSGFQVRFEIDLPAIMVEH